MAVRHADLTPSRESNLGSKTGVFLIVLSILCGICSFVLCLVAETRRSTATWLLSSVEGKTQRYECIYSGSGKVPLLCSAGAFLILALAMVMEHVYMLVAVSKQTPPALIAWNPDCSSAANSLTRRAAFIFVATWISFATAEIILMIGICIESGHLSRWSRGRLSCLVVRQGLFLSAGLFGVTAVLLLLGLYLTALHAQQLQDQEETLRREVLDTAVYYASPHRTMPNVAQIPRPREEHHHHHDPPSINKSICSLV